MTTPAPGSRVPTLLLTLTGPDRPGVTTTLFAALCHDGDGEIAGANDAHQGVQVRAVAIDQPATTVDQLDHLDDVLLEQPQGVGIG